MTHDPHDDRTPVVLIANPGADVYGSDLQMLESLAALRDAGWRVVVTSPEDGPLRTRIESLGATFDRTPVPVVRRSYLSPRGLAVLTRELAGSLAGMRALLRRVDPDVVYVNTTIIPWWIAVARALRLPVVTHVHEAEDQDNKLALRALNAPLLLSDRLLLISQTTREAVVGLFPVLADRSVLLRNGVPDRPTPPVAPPPADGPVRLAYAARLSPRKGTDVAIRTLAELVGRGYDVTLEVAGSHFEGYEWYVEELHELVAAAGLRDRVTFSGYVSPVHGVFDRSHVVLAPSLREPFGNAVVEAQLAARPVVAAAAAGHLESIVDGESGLLVTPGNPVAAADAVASLIDDPGRSTRLGQQARKSALARFGTQRYADELVAVVAQLRDERRMRRAGRRRFSARGSARLS